jgi:hypothetical protein
MCFQFYDVRESKWIYGGDFYVYSKRRVGKHAKGIVLNLCEVHCKMYLGTLNKRHDEPQWNRRPRSDCKIGRSGTRNKLNWIPNFMTRILNVPSSNFRCCTWYPNWGTGGFSLTSLCWDSNRCMQLSTLLYLVPNFKPRVAWSLLDW